MKKRVICAILSMVLAVSAVGINVSQAAVSVTLNQSALYISGYPDNTFKPEDKMTRAEAVKTVAVICGFPKNFTGVDIKSKFSDIPDGEWYTPYVKHLESKEMLDFLSGKFQQDKEITRAEFIRLVSPLIKNVEGDSAFSDLPSSHPYSKAVIKAANAGIITGYPDGTFRPQETLKRCEIVVIINRIIERNTLDVRIDDIQSFSDIEGHWAKSAIVAASTRNIMSGKTLWYTGEVYASNSPAENYTMELSTTTAILDSAKSDSAKDVETAIEAYADKRREEIRNTPTSIEVTGTKYYVSNDGNDANDGLTPETAWKTLDKVSKAKLNSGDGVFFRRGDLFRGKVSVVYEGITYSAYGEGEKPKIYGSKRNYSESEFWDKTDKENVYVSKESFSSDVGLIVFNDGEAWSIKKVDGLQNFDGVLRSDLEMYHNPKDKKIYLYSTSDPDTRFTSTEIGENDVLFHSAVNGGGSGTTVDNICMMYTGGYGVEFNYGVKNITVQNCEIGWVGGSLQPTNTRIVRYGNGVEIYGGCDGFYIDNCYMYQIYDTAITHQYFGSNATISDPTKCHMKNIKYTDNLIEYCTWGIEVSNTSSKGNGFMKDVEISGNLLLNSGEGWGVQRPYNNPCGLMHRAGATQMNYSENYFVFDNVIYGRDAKANLIECGAESLSAMPRMEGNLFVGVKGNPFGLCGVLENCEKILMNPASINMTVGFENNKFYFLDK